MIDSFFGVHPHVIRSGLWAKMKPGEKDLYVYLMEQSEWAETRVLKRTDAHIRSRVGAAPRTLCNARKRLQEYGLVRYRRGDGNKYHYTICNPVSGEPYPGDPTVPIACPKTHKRRAKRPHRTGDFPLSPQAESGELRVPSNEHGIEIEF